LTEASKLHEGPTITGLVVIKSATIIYVFLAAGRLRPR
jgi:hypothetical protein